MKPIQASSLPPSLGGRCVTAAALPHWPAPPCLRVTTEHADLRGRVSRPALPPNVQICTAARARGSPVVSPRRCHGQGERGRHQQPRRERMGEMSWRENLSQVYICGRERSLSIFRGGSYSCSVFENYYRGRYFKTSTFENR